MADHLDKFGSGRSPGRVQSRQQEAGASSELDPESLVEVYRTDNDLVAGLVVNEILRPAGIRAACHDRRSHSIVAPASMPGEIGIAVPAHQAAAARQRLVAARQDGVLHNDGTLIEADLT